MGAEERYHFIARTVCHSGYLRLKRDKKAVVWRANDADTSRTVFRFVALST